MSWREREYSPEDSPGSGLLRPLLWLWNGTVPLGQLFGVRIRMHAMFVVLAVLSILLAKTRFAFFGFAGQSYSEAAIFLGILFGLVLMHEFGHIAAARLVGGQAEEILLWPLGGLAYTDVPHRPWATLATAAGGPMVNVVVCLLTAGGLMWMGLGRYIPLNPFNAFLPPGAHYLGLIFLVSYGLLLFNLLPIYPLDGGQMFQALLWPSIGYFRAMNVACIIGMGGAIFIGTWGLLDNSWIMVAIAISGFSVCLQKRMLLREIGPDALEDSLDFSASMEEAPPQPRRRHLTKRAIRRARKLIQREQSEQARIDAVLAKVSAHGIRSLTWLERRVLHKATARQRQRDLELTSGQ